VGEHSLFPLHQKRGKHRTCECVKGRMIAGDFYSCLVGTDL
jgi:hypothetical protein